jgi:hypothetical protein
MALYALVAPGNVILREQNFSDEPTGTGKGNAWLPVVIVGSGPISTDAFPGGQVTRTLRAKNAGEIDADKDAIIASEMTAAIGQAFGEIYDALYMMALQTTPTLTKTQFQNALNNFRATAATGNFVAFTATQIRTHLKTFLA